MARKPVSDETREKMAAARRGKKWSAEVRAKMSASRMGKPRGPHSAEHKAKIAEANRGKKRPHTEEWKELMSVKMKGHSVSPETAAKISAAKRAKPHVYTAEQRAKMSEGQKRFNATQTYEQKVEKRANAIEAFRKADHGAPRMNTKIELYVAEFLRQAGVEFEHPYIVGAMEADFYIPAINTIVEVQGCYWHGCEKCGFIEGEFFAEQRLRDKRRFGYFAERSYKIRTIWEHEIKKNILDNLMKLIPPD